MASFAAGWLKATRSAVSLSRTVGARRTLHATPTRFAASYAVSMYDAWAKDPSSVHSAWASAFSKYPKEQVFDMVRPVDVQMSGGDGALSEQLILDHMKVQALIRAYRVRGHIAADVNPLSSQGSLEYSAHVVPDPKLNLSDYGFSDADLDRTFSILGVSSYETLFPQDTKSLTLRDITQRLEKLYCGNVGYQFKFIQNDDENRWIQQKIEDHNQNVITTEEKKVLMERLITSDGFEQFLQKKFPAEKRFGLDGCEVLIPGMNEMIAHASGLGVRSVVIGMPHRGRLNVLCNVLGKPLEALLYEFSDYLHEDDVGQGDVKYHLGASTEIDVNGQAIAVSLLANPSHLEAVNPVLLGKVRAKQDYLKEASGVDERGSVLPILVHGDAAFAGQGVVHECFGLAQLPSYETGGTVHIIVNNQVGFTTDPRFARSSLYCSDLGKMIEAPIVHVNSDSVEDVIRVFQMAAEYRQKFKKDFIIDLVCYRKFGHNESDQPAFTQPLMYQFIQRMTPVKTKYSEQLLEEGVVDRNWLEAKQTEYEAAANESYIDAQEGGSYVPTRDVWLDSFWKGFKRQSLQAAIMDTGVELETLVSIGNTIGTTPDDFQIHKTLKNTLKKRLHSTTSGTGLDWATAEALAFGSLLLEGKAVRISGQDVERGTFNQRHHVLHDSKEDLKTYTALENLAEKQGRYMVHNSHLSEYAVLGFELGYSQQNPHSLVCWEAQFGDFANTAQCMIDQFISSGEEKWGRQTGLVMLLPHGQEGQGPEHSSCRIERYLQMCNDDESVFPEMMDHFARSQIEISNMQVVNATTPANYFHVLRRQVHREFRKPLIIATPKSLLRAPFATSSYAEMGPGTRFLRFIPEVDRTVLPELTGEAPDVRRLILCSGKVYYDLVKQREENGHTDVAIARVEQISPFPFDLVNKHAANFPNAEIVWCQEEPKNQGCWSYVRPRIETSLQNEDRGRPRYVGRKPMASTSPGGKGPHTTETKAFLEAAFA
eukprot:m.184966 g.184966  ORF g.184966 m.184966 type:complete len:993 (-) comp32214_c3_seq1:110-3088(-)